MTRWPVEFPWQIIAALVIAILCFLGACFAVAVAAGRAFRDRRREPRRGDVPPVRDWTAYPNTFNDDWYRRGR